MRGWVRVVRGAGWACAIAAVAVLHIWQAVVTPTFAFDEPLWFMRSQVFPADLSKHGYRYWAIDIPAVNRWVWYPILKATGLDVVPEGEKEVWQLDDDGRICFFTWRLPDAIKLPGTLEEWKAEHGYYAPRKAVIAMRMANLAAYAAMVFCLWIVAKIALESGVLAVLAIAPVLITPLFAGRMAFESSSGDIYCMAAMAGGLALWTRGHCKGHAAEWPTAVGMGVLCGIATASKHVGIFALAAYWVYLLIYAEGWRKAVFPAISSAVAFVVFAVIDPVVIVDPAGPVRVCIQMVERRFQLVRAIVAGRGPLTWTEYCEKALFWWPLLPVMIYAGWHCRKEAWFAPVAIWGAVCVAGALWGLALTRLLTPHYLAPVELGIYFPAALMVIARTRAARATPTAAGQDGVAGGV